jgi:hypothetical protein
MNSDLSVLLVQLNESRILVQMRHPVPTAFSGAHKESIVTENIFAPLEP